LGHSSSNLFIRIVSNESRKRFKRDFLSKKAFCSSISGALAARAMFESIGVGDENATAYGATLTWIIKGNQFKIKKTSIRRVTFSN
jgi:hypothetical protein